MNTVLTVIGVNSVRISGIETYARELSAQLGQHGWQSVVCFHNQPPELVRQYLNLPNVSLDAVPNPWDAGWRQADDLMRVVGRYRPRILHLLYTGFLSSYPWLGKLCGAEKVFFTDQTSHPEGHIPRRAAFWKRALARAINWPLSNVICVSDYGLRCNVARGLLPAERYHRIYNAVELSRDHAPPGLAAQFRRKYAIPDERVLITQLSWMIPEKGIEDLLEAARLVIARNPNAHFAMVGDGAWRERFMRHAVALGIADSVTWTGNVLTPFEEGVFAASDIVCQVSRWEEVFGFVMAEGMICRKPIVATRVGGIPELVEDGRSGFLVERRDVAGIAEKLLLLCENRELRERMGAAGRETAIRKFDLQNNVSELLRLYGVTPEPARAALLKERRLPDRAV